VCIEVKVVDTFRFHIAIDVSFDSMYFTTKVFIGLEEKHTRDIKNISIVNEKKKKSDISVFLNNWHVHKTGRLKSKNLFAENSFRRWLFRAFVRIVMKQ